LAAARLATEPDFNTVGIDAPIRYLARQDVAPSESIAADPAVSVSGVELDGPTADTSAADPAYRLHRLDDGSQELVFVRHDDDLRRATTLMMTNDFSQLPVFSGPRTLRGVISWKSIGIRYALGGTPATVSDAMLAATETVDAETPLFSAIPRIIANDYVLVRRADHSYWIITAADLSAKFRELSEPFLLLSEIETHLRSLVDEKVERNQIRDARDPTDEKRQVDAAADLTLGELVRLIENPVVWQAIAPTLDRDAVIPQLNRVRAIRNEVMHFDPEGLGPTALDELRDFVRFLREFRQWRPNAAGPGR
jgi:CBS domain-containing protein